MKTAANIGEFVNLYLKHQQQKIEMQTNKLGFNPIPDGVGGLLHQLFGKLALALSILIFVIQKPYDNFSWAIL